MNKRAANTRTGGSGRKERRLRRKTDRRELAQLRKLKPVAVYAIRYVGSIDAPNPHEPWDIAKRRDDLVAVVKAYQGQPEKTRRDPGVVRLVSALRELPAPFAGSSNRLLTLPPAPQRQTQPPAHTAYMAPERVRVLRDVEVKRRELHNAAKKLGAEANKRHINHARVAELEVELDAASSAYAAACASVAGRRTA